MSLRTAVDEEREPMCLGIFMRNSLSAARPLFRKPFLSHVARCCGVGIFPSMIGNPH